MAEICFDTGEERWDLNGRCQVGFNPTDMEFAARLCEAFARLEALYGGFPGPEESPFARAVSTYGLYSSSSIAVRKNLTSAPSEEKMPISTGSTRLYALEYPHTGKSPALYERKNCPASTHTT